MKKTILIAGLTMLLIIGMFSIHQRLLSQDCTSQCDSDNYLIGGNVVYVIGFGSWCMVCFEVCYYTDELGAGEQVYVHYQPENHPEGEVRMAMSYYDHGELCTQFRRHVNNLGPDTFEVWFTCEYLNENGRDPDEGVYIMEIENDCTYEWYPPPE